jgi:diguanylate cyclase (GGDEF)-like protein
MGPRRSEGTGSGSRLFLMYAVPSLVLMVLLGVVLARHDRSTGRELGLDQGRDQAAVIEQTAIAPAVGAGDLAAGLSQAALVKVRQATDLAIFSGSVTRLRLRSFSGSVVFSDDGSGGMDALPSSDPAFRTAAAGNTSAAVVTSHADSSTRVIRILEPIVPNSSGRATGILEIYLPYAAIAHKIQAELNSTYVRLAVGLGAMYMILALIAWSTTRRLRRHAAERHHQAMHDSLTGLPNREWFRSRADAAMRRAERGEVGALVLIDLDHFKDVNDTLGHHAGDALLQVVAERLSGSLRTDDTVARLGGDEFGLVLPGLSEPQQAVALLETIRAVLADEIVIESVSLSVEARFGIAMYPEHGTSTEQLLRRADAAMYEGKRGAASIVVYDPNSGSRQRPGLIIQGELRQALDRDELVLHYQPQVDLATGLTDGVEALVRWQHPTRGLLSPVEFVPAAEESGLIEPLTDWVLRRALADQQQWVALGMNWRVSVNVSARNLSSPTFAERAMRLLARMGNDPGRLCLEVTETALSANPEATSATITTLSDAGIAISIDDFGTGYTGLWQLRTIVVDEVKIDQAFVTDLITSGQDRSIVLAIIGLSHGLGCTVTAEGVETEAAAQWLQAAGCDAAQGYYFARPAPWSDLLPDHVQTTASALLDSSVPQPTASRS